jgi:hypothetical protein
LISWSRHNSTSYFDLMKFDLMIISQLNMVGGHV